MSDEEQLREELRRQEEIAEKKAMMPKPNPLGEEHLRKIAPYKIETEEEREKRQAKNREEPKDTSGNNGHPAPFYEFDTGSQRGLLWRKRMMDKVRNYFGNGASYEWVIWKLKKETGMVKETARSIVEDALDEEPKKEPSGSPKKKAIEGGV